MCEHCDRTARIVFWCRVAWLAVCAAGILWVSFRGV